MSLISLDDYEKEAAKFLSKTNWGFIRSGAGDEITLNLNRTSFDKLRILPRFLRDVSKRDLSTKLYGDSFSFPLGIAPAAAHRIAHIDGEIATAKAAGKLNIPYIMSTLSTFSIEEVAQAAPDTVKWLQLYVYNDKNYTESLIKRAERSGFKALVLTVDAPILGLRRNDLRDPFFLPSHLKLQNLPEDFEKRKESLKTMTPDSSLTWEDVKRIMKQSKLPLIIKGILTKEDAEIAVNQGVAGIVVSNHGARQLDNVPATIEVLPEIVKAVQGRIPVLLDGGVRQGTDIFKAIALGADFVFVGRPVFYGLALKGQQGVEDMLMILKNEFDNCMCLAGCRSLKDVSGRMVVHESRFAKL